MIRRARSAAAAALLLSVPFYSTIASARTLVSPQTHIPHAVRQSAAVVYPQCDEGEKTHIASIMGACSGCLNGGCPESCCSEQPTSNQWVICQIPEPGAAGCCIRVMGNGQVEVAASEVVTTKGKNEAGTCQPADPGTPSQCPTKTCALAGAGGGKEKDCPGGVLVTPPNQQYSSPATCATAPAGAGTAAATVSATDPVTVAAAATTVAPAAGAAVAAAAGTSGVGAASGSGATVAGVIPAGCTKTFPGFRCMGDEGFPEVEYKGGCCVGECKKDPAKGWGYWCPALSGAPSGASSAAGGAVATETTNAPEVAASSAATVAPTTVAPTTVAVATTAEASTQASTLSPSSSGEESSQSISAEPTPVEESGDADGVVVETEAPSTTEANSTASSPAAVVTVATTTTRPPVVAVTTKPTSSTNATKVGSTEDSGSACFHGSGMVELETGSLKKMADLEVGDSVKVGPGMYSRVFMFSHRNVNEMSQFLKLSLQSGHEIVVTPGHYMWSDQGMIVSEGVKKGDMLLLGDGGASAVTDVTRMEDNGVFNPQTLHGDIVVNDIKASTLTRAMPPAMARTLLAPLQAAYLAFGLSMKGLESGAVASAVAGYLPKGPSSLSV